MRPQRMMLLTGAVVLAVAAKAEAAGVTASLDRPEAELGDPVVLTVTVEGRDASEPKLPALPAFEVQPRGRSTQMQIINGKFSSQVSYSYELDARQAGNFTIGPVSVSAGGHTYTSQPLTLRVLGSGAGAGRGAGAPAADQKAREVEEGDAFVRATVSTTEPFVGERVVYTFRFYRRHPVAGARLQGPEFPGFGVESLGDQVERTVEEHGQLYNVTEVKKALFAKEPGTVTIPSSTLSYEVEVREERRRGATPFGGFADPFAGFFGERTRTRALKTRAITLDVKPLPPAPRDFSGLIGAFGLKTTVSKSELRVGESATLAITVSGRGDVGAVTEPTLPEVAALRLYDDKPEAESHVEGETIVGSKTFKKALVPREAGEITFPALSLVYFDPANGRYQTATSAPIALRVTPGQANSQVVVAGGEAVAPAASGKAAVQVVGDDILPNQSHARLWNRADRRRWGVAAIAGLGLPPLLFALALAIARRRERLMNDGAFKRRRGAFKRGHHALDAARKRSARGGSDAEREAIVAAERAFKSFLGDALNAAGLALTAADVEAQLATRGLEAGLIRRTVEEVRKLEAARFGGTLAGEVDVAALLSSLDALLRELERALRSP